MAKYSDIKGFTVQTVSTDPVASAVAGGAWASGGNLPSVLYENAGAGATQNASMNFGGQGNSPSPQFPHTADTQTYNGTSWTEVNELNNSRRYLAGAGVLTSALAYGGYTVPPSAPGTKDFCESWDGTNWTEVNELNTKRREVAGIGTSNSNALCVQGTDGTSVTAEVESWNGSAWPAISEANTLRFRRANTGSNTAAIITGGEVPSTADSALVESWNGSAWTEIAEINTARSQFSAAGTYTDALVMGGSPNLANTEYYDGSSWSEQADLSLGRYINYGSSGDTVAQGMVFGGNAPTPLGSRTTSTEEWSQPSTFTKQIEGQLFYNSTTNSFKETILDVPGGTWASASAIPASGYFWGSAGTQTSNIIAGGYGPSGIIGTAFQYDGTDWTSAPSINDAREMVTGWGASSTAAVIVAGDSPGFVGKTEQFDGSSWTEKDDLNTTRIQGGGAGTSYTSGIFFGGRTPPNTKKDETEEWNGSTWSEKNDLNTAIRAVAGFGTTTAAISAGGDAQPATQTGVESWDGSSWTELSGTLNTGRNSLAVSGTQTAGLVFGGSPPVTNKTEAWNGTAFTEVGDMGNSLYARGGSPAGTQTAALA